MIMVCSILKPPKVCPTSDSIGTGRLGLILVSFFYFNAETLPDSAVRIGMIFWWKPDRRRGKFSLFFLKLSFVFSIMETPFAKSLRLSAQQKLSVREMVNNKNC